MQKHGNTETQTHTDSDEYSIVAFCKNATIKNIRESRKRNMILKGLCPHVGCVAQ